MLNKGKVLVIDGNKFIISDILYDTISYLDKVYVLSNTFNKKKEYIFGETELMYYVREDRKFKINNLIF